MAYLPFSTGTPLPRLVAKILKLRNLAGFDCAKSAQNLERQALTRKISKNKDLAGISWLCLGGNASEIYAECVVVLAKYLD